MQACTDMTGKPGDRRLPVPPRITDAAHRPPLVEVHPLLWAEMGGREGGPSPSWRPAAGAGALAF